MPELTPTLLELLAHGITAILATWLGLTVLLRAASRPGGRVFVLVTGLLVIWSVTIIVQRLSGVGEIMRPANALEELGSSLLPPATLHIALALTVEGRRTSIQQLALLTAYLLGGIAAFQAGFFPDARFAVTPPHFAVLGIPGEAFGWGWIVLRGGMFALAIGWILASMRTAGADPARNRQLRVTLATVAVGAIGGMVRMTPPLSDSEPWLGVSLVTAAVVLATYAVFAQGLFFGQDVAGRAFRYSVVVGGAVTAYVVVLLAADTAVRLLLGIDLPLVIAFGLVGTMALFEPTNAAVRRWLSAADGADHGYERLLRALGESILTSQRPERAIEPALARLTRTFRISGAAALGPGGEQIAAHGHVPDSPLALHLPLRSNDAAFGTVIFGPKRSQLPFTAGEAELLRTAVAFLAASLQLSEREEHQAAELDVLSAQRADVATQGSELHRALVEVPLATEGLEVFALGALRAQRGEQLIQSWGGKKAGSRQAEGLFAFLFDRGERGISKDETIELIWPDADLDRADLAFHRTLGGLRRTLEPEQGRSASPGAIVFHNDRYRLDPSVVSWSDVDAFAERLAAAAHAETPELELAALHEARALYRGEYLDDCPFYGDSAQVEERRELLRARYVDLLLALGERYEARGDRSSAAAYYREARLVSGDECPPAVEALRRIGRQPAEAQA